MDAISKFRAASGFQCQNRAAANLNSIIPERETVLDHADIALYEMVPEQARTQPVSDSSIYSVKPKKFR